MDDITKYLDKSEWRVRENSNMSYSLQGLNYHISSSAIARYWLEDIYSDDISVAHITGLFHIHDLSSFSTYCCGWDLYDLITRGFDGVFGKVASKPPKHFSSALGQLVNFFYTLQGEAAGAMAVSSFDTLLAPFVWADGLAYHQVKQAMQEFIFNMNVPTRVGFQTPFTNITMDVSVSPLYADQPVIVGGKPDPVAVYSDMQPYMNYINRAFAEIMLEGDAAERIFSFPIPTYNITDDFPWDSNWFSSMWEMTAKYGTPYFANFINGDMKPEDVRSMCCRLRIDNTKLQKRLGGLFSAVPLTGSIGVVTLNLPRLAHGVTGKEFIENLDYALNLAVESLEIKREVIEKYTERGLYPYSAHYLGSVKEKSGKYWDNHFSTIGIIGMHEACLEIFGEGIDKRKEFALYVLKYIERKLEDVCKKTNHLYNLEASPAEGATYRLAKLNREFGGLPDPLAQYLTNSTHLPVGYTDDIVVALDHQEELQIAYTGGTVFHAFLGERIDDWKMARAFVKTILSKYKIPYLSLTPTFSICNTHGYISGEHFTCPHCGKECEVYSRVVGYIRPVQNWNTGKVVEFSDRKTYNAS